MTRFRSRRLEALLGSFIDPDHLRFEHLERLVAGRVAEDTDLDYKSDDYNTSSNKGQDKYKLSGDVTALANADGGLIICGVAEDQQGRAVGIPRVTLADSEINNMLQSVATQVTPMPSYNIFSVEDPLHPGMGCYVIAVSRSPRRPHGVVINKGLRWPRRSGRTTVYMTEPEIETAYLARSARGRDQQDRAEAIERTALPSLLQDTHRIWLLLSLVPEARGQMLIDHTSFIALLKEHAGSSPLLWDATENQHWRRMAPASKRIRMDGTSTDRATGVADHLLAELYTDGSSVFAFQLGNLLPKEVEKSNPYVSDPLYRLSDEQIALGLLSGLRMMARHARDNALTGGQALIRARIFPIDREHPTELGMTNIEEGSSRLGFVYLTGESEPSEAAAWIEDLAEDGPPLVSAAALLGDDIAQGFGMPECLQFTSQGCIYLDGWHSLWQEKAAAWAEACGVECTNLPDWAAQAGETEEEF